MHLCCRTMFLRRIQISILHSILHQRSNLSTFKPKFPPPKSSIKPKLINHKDWLTRSETVNIIKNLDPNLAAQVFDELSERKDYNPNEEIYSVVIKKLGLAKRFDYIDTLMERIKFENRKLSDQFFYDVIKVYGFLGGRINRAIYTLYDMPTYQVWPSVKTFNLVLNLLVHTKQFEVIHEVFLNARELCVEIDACCLNIVIKGLCYRGEFDAAFDVLKEFDNLNIRPTVITFSTIMDDLCNRGRVDEALGVFDRMEKEGVDADVITFNILIKGLRKVGKFQEAIDIMGKMLPRGCEPNMGTLQAVLYCLLDAKRFVEAKEFVGKMSMRNLKPSFESYKAMLDEFCKDDDVENVDWVLKQMACHRFKPSIRMWNQSIKCVLSGANFSSFNFSPYEEIIGCAI